MLPVMLDGMRWILALLLFLPACAHQKLAENHFHKMDELCKRAVANEDAPPRPDSGLGIQGMYVQSIGSDFWKTYSDARLAAGDRRARKELKTLLERYGASAALLVPINSDLRGAEDNAIIDAWLASGGRSTTHLKQMFGDPPDLRRAAACRQGVLR
ncbi:hypothetical protein [Prosthecobacter vanneervenii]|uniref:Uncharacterized protein n=1 Tax=Prosthecobacter vanneervenii TaxID=48466 RepID=A0A7W8DME2_9BACT|nr:hypothetical protein [Prosthecobacter vanneervenii]MBB5034970.1 hypothetical protein [Prosthecobacter vanneervenii]